MNYLNQLFEQTRTLVLSLTPGSRMVAGIMLLAIVVGSGFLVRDIQQTNMELIFNGHVFKESELSLAETAMSNAKLNKYERDGLRIRVPSNERDLYIKALAEGGATPQQLGSATSKALTSGNMLESMFMSKTRILDARQKDMSNVLQQLPFVDKVFVTYDEKREGFASQTQSTAAVYVLPQNNRPLTEQQKRSIMQQVAAGFAGLKYENVSVMDMSSGLSMPGSSDPLNSEQQRYYQQKAHVEHQLKEKATNLLADYGAVRVEANVEIDPTLREETEDVKYDAKPVTLQISLSKKDSESSKPVTGGRPGAEPNAIANRSQTLDSTKEQSSKSKEQQESEKKITGQTTTLSEKIGGTIKSASLSVSIPLSYYSIAFRREWEEINPGKPMTEPMGRPELTALKESTQKKIQTLLANLLPATPGVDSRPNIVVVDYLDMPVATIPGPSLSTTAGSWFASNWQSLAMFGLAGIVLLSIRSFVANGSRGNEDAAFERGFDIPLDNAVDIDLASLSSSELTAAGGDESGDGVGGEAGSEGKDARSRFSTTGGDIRAELASLVKENPDVAASLLRTWIGDAA